MWSCLCLSILLCFVDRVTAQNPVDALFISVVVLVSVMLCIAYSSIMIINIAILVYKKYKSDKNATFAANPNVKEKDLEKSIVVGNPNAQLDDTPMPQFGTADTIVHREDHTSPIQ
ncbi:hypothetical protein LOD99_9398 [Oopsacas minuta]|uniref:Uncharacterized protein n=1 Tax=Oopsacas minuta TaxID=111878 RepID=A0AAV7JC01_9METZ|nr:hypothetical protein LOD99_9398 [Oopsacas minuta]